MGRDFHPQLMSLKSMDGNEIALKVSLTCKDLEVASLGSYVVVRGFSNRKLLHILRQVPLTEESFQLLERFQEPAVSSVSEAFITEGRSL